MKHIKNPHFLIPAGLLAADALLFSLTDPGNVHSFMLIIAFLMLTATLYFLIKGAVLVAGWYGLKVKHKRRLTMLLTGLCSGLVALQSINQLTQRDILVVLPLSVLGYLYVSYGRSKPQTNPGQGNAPQLNRFG